MKVPPHPYAAALYRLSSLFTWRGLKPFLEREYGRIPAGARVLTVGAGGRFNALLYPHARARPFEVIAFDIDPARAPSIVGDLCAAPFRASSFDAVILGEVLEHVHAPWLAIENLHRLLVPGGALILTTPFIFPIHERRRDYFRYTRYGLELLLCDFRDVRITERSSWAESINALWTRLSLEESAGARIVAPFALAAAMLVWPLAWVAGRMIHTDFITMGYLVTARK